MQHGKSSGICCSVSWALKIMSGTSELIVMMMPMLAKLAAVEMSALHRSPIGSDWIEPKILT